MVRKYKNKENDLCIDMDSSTHGTMLRIMRLTEESPTLFEISLWKYAGVHNSFLNRFKAAWKMLRTGYSYDSIVVTSTCLKELKEIL